MLLRQTSRLIAIEAVADDTDGTDNGGNNVVVLLVDADDDDLREVLVGDAAVPVTTTES